MGYDERRVLFFVCPLFEHIKNENRCETDRIVCED